MHGVSALVTVVLLGFGAVSIYSLHTYVTTMSDAELGHSLAAFEHSYAKWRADESADVSGPGVDRALTDFTGQATATLIAVVENGRVTDSAIFSDGGNAAAPAEAISAIESADLSQEAPRTVSFGALGDYRMASIAVGGGARLVSALSLDNANRAVATKTVAVVGITLAAVLLTAVGTVALVRQSLRPLRRVAATAAKAAKMPLTDEDHRIVTRVRKADSDPDNEVGIVGETLNRLLANVDSALAARAASDRRMRRFLTDASHELRTPLAAIQGYAQLTRRESAALPATTEYALARIESESRRMTALVGDMLLLSRLDEGQGLETRRVDLGALAADAVNDAVVSAPGHHWLADLPAEPAWVMGDRARLHQVLSNLLANAHHHTPPGVTVTTAIRVATGVTGRQVQLTVVDDGPGIDAKLIPDLFDRFVRGHGGDGNRSDDSNGTGLGLAIVASITEAHGGTVTARSGGGATEFRIALPAAQ